MPLKNVQNGKEFSVEMRESFVKFNNLIDKRLPEKVEVLLEKVITDSFQAEEYQDKKSSKWQGRKKKDLDDAGRKLLIGKGSGKLKRSIEVSRDGKEIKASTDVVYAQIHNEGLQGKAFGKYPFKMPQRQYMPIPGEANQVLDDAVEKWLDGEMDKIFG
jgi:phage gpG-like protein